MLMNQQYILNKVFLNRNTHKTRHVLINWWNVSICLQEHHCPRGSDPLFTNSVFVETLQNKIKLYFCFCQLIPLDFIHLRIISRAILYKNIHKNYCKWIILLLVALDDLYIFCLKILAKSNKLLIMFRYIIHSIA